MLQGRSPEYLFILTADESHQINAVGSTVNPLLRNKQKKNKEEEEAEEHSIRYVTDRESSVSMPPFIVLLTEFYGRTNGWIDRREGESEIEG